MPTRKYKIPGTQLALYYRTMNYTRKRRKPGPTPKGLVSRNYRLYLQDVEKFKTTATNLGLNSSQLLRGIMARIGSPNKLARFLTPNPNPKSKSVDSATRANS